MRSALAGHWPEDLRGRALLVVAGCLVCQMGLGYGYAFAPLAPDLLEAFGWSRAQLSAGRIPQLAVVAVGSSLLGVLTVRFGARPILIVASVLLGLAFGGVATITSLWQLYALYMLQGLATTGLGDITVGQVVARWATRSRGLALGMVYVGSNLGGALLTRLGPWIADEVSWRAAFAGLGIAGVLVMLPCAAFLVRDPPPGRAPAERVAVGAARPHADADLDLRAALRTRSFWILAGTLFSFFFYFLGMIEHLVLFLTDEGMPRAAAAANLSNAVFLGVASKIGFGWLADRIPPRAAILLDYGLLTLSSLLLLALPDARLLLPFVLCYGIATAARDVVTPLMIVECFGVRHLASIYGAIMLALLPGGGLGPLFAAAVHDRTGSYDGAFLTFAALNALAFAALFGLRREARPAGAPA
jgi:MFS family permease